MDAELAAEFIQQQQADRQRADHRRQLAQQIQDIRDAPPIPLPTSRQIGMRRAGAFLRARAIARWTTAAADVHSDGQRLPSRGSSVGVG